MSKDKTPIDLNDRRREKEEREKKKKLKAQDIYRNIAKAINFDFTSIMPEFPVTYKVIEPEGGIRNIVRIDDDDVCTYVRDEELKVTLANYFLNSKYLVDNDYYKLGQRQLTDCILNWKQTARPIEEPKAVRFKDEPGLTFRRLPWNFDPEGPCETFDELFSRMDNSYAAQDFIASIFVEGSYRQQYLYLYGQGNDGKGSLVSFLLRVMGQVAKSLDCPIDTYGNVKNSHWTTNLIGLRLGIFDDLEMFKLPSTGFFKSLTGLDVMSVNPKGKPGYNAPINTKFIFTSNKLPQLSSSKADTRRAIFCDIELPSEIKDVETYSDRLWEEGGYFLSKCIQNYLDRYPNPKRPIECETDAIEAIAEEIELKWEIILDRYFVLEKDAQIICKEFAMVLQFEACLSNSDISKFKHWLKGRHRVLQRRPKFGTEDRNRYYLNIRKKSNVEGKNL